MRKSGIILSVKITRSRHGSSYCTLTFEDGARFKFIASTIYERVDEVGSIRCAHPGNGPDAYLYSLSGRHVDMEGVAILGGGPVNVSCRTLTLTEKKGN